MSNPLRQYLVKNGVLSDADFTKAEENAAKEKTSVTYAIEKLGTVDEGALLEALSKMYRVPKTALHEMDIPTAIIATIPKEVAMKHRVVPIDRAGNNVIIATADPRNINALDAIRFASGFFPKPVLASETRLREAIEKYYGNMLDIGSNAKSSAMPEIEIRKKEQAKRVDISFDGGGDGPIIKIVNQILVQCLTRKASDIHIEPYESFVRVRLRIDGVLHEILRPPLELKAALTSRMKIMAGVNIAETRLPQDGAISVSIGGKPVDFRVNTLPTNYGEKIVMRILDKSSLQVDMTKLGFEVDELAKFKASISSPFGMVLVTGPTGSGKTTTLYSALADLNQVSDNIMTAEDPIEFQLEGINQVQMKPDIGLNFATALKAFLRQDPDVIMVGEIRDQETAEISIKAALTGHMVLSTLHTNSAPDTISRLLNMGVESFNLVSALTCITAQRLLRKVCEGCRIVDESVTPEVMIQMGIHPQWAAKIKAYKGKGCLACGGSGNKGRVACHEVLKMNDPIREAILENMPAMRIKKVAMDNGMRSLRQSALTKMAAGIASAAEVVGATSSDSDDGKSNAA